MAETLYHHQTVGGWADRSPDDAMTNTNMSSQSGIDEELPSIEQTVFIWDVDETLVTFQSLKDGQWARECWKGKDEAFLDSLGKRWRLAVHKMTKALEAKLKANTVEVAKVADNVGELYVAVECGGIPKESASARGKEATEDEDEERFLAGRFQLVETIYYQGVGSVVSPEEEAKFQQLYEDTDEVTDGWLSAGRSLLHACEEASATTPGDVRAYLGRRIRRQRDKIMNDKDGGGGKTRTAVKRAKLNRRAAIASAGDGPRIKATGENVNIVVSSAVLVPTLAKLMLFHYNDLIHPLNVYTSRGTTKLEVFHRIKTRFTPKSDNDHSISFCVVGDSQSELEAAKALRWPSVMVRPEKDGLRLTDLSFSKIADALGASKESQDGEEQDGQAEDCGVVQ